MKRSFTITIDKDIAETPMVAEAIRELEERVEAATVIRSGTPASFATPTAAKPVEISVLNFAKNNQEKKIEPLDEKKKGGEKTGRSEMASAVEGAFLVGLEKSLNDMVDSYRRLSKADAEKTSASSQTATAESQPKVPLVSDGGGTDHETVMKLAQTLNLDMTPEVKEVLLRMIGRIPTSEKEETPAKGQPSTEKIGGVDAPLPQKPARKTPHERYMPLVDAIVKVISDNISNN